jgi:hypothetical protein
MIRPNSCTIILMGVNLFLTDSYGPKNIHVSLRNATIFELLEGISTTRRDSGAMKTLSFVGRTELMMMINSTATEKGNTEDVEYSNLTTIHLNVHLREEEDLFTDVPFTQWQRGFLTTPWDDNILANARNLTFNIDVDPSHERAIMVYSNTTIEVQEVKTQKELNASTEHITENDVEIEENNEVLWIEDTTVLETYDNVGTHNVQNVVITNHEKDEAIDVQFQSLDLGLFCIVIFATAVCRWYTKRGKLQREHQSVGDTDDTNTSLTLPLDLPKMEQLSKEDYIDSVSSSPLLIDQSYNGIRVIESVLETDSKKDASHRGCKTVPERHLTSSTCASQLDDNNNFDKDCDDESLLDSELNEDINNYNVDSEGKHLRCMPKFTSKGVNIDFQTIGDENGSDEFVTIHKNNDSELERHDEKICRNKIENTVLKELCSELLGSPERLQALQCSSCTNYIKELETMNVEQRICMSSLEKQIKEQSISIMNLESHIESLNYEMMIARHDHQLEQERMYKAYEELKTEASKLTEWMKCQISGHSPERSAQIEKYKEESDLESLTLSEKEKLKQEIEDERKLWMSELTDIQLSFSARSAGEIDVSDDSSMDSNLSMDSEEM